MEIKDNKIEQVLAGIDRVSERATKIVSSIDKDALADAKVEDLSLSDVQARVNAKNVNHKPNTNTQKDHGRKVTLG